MRQRYFDGKAVAAAISQELCKVFVKNARAAHLRTFRVFS